ncbi:hypothetical protein BX616_008771 [Lobosporangium transversale]|nr:hypothetical protein BX616_008771 [Lobosporangium transversale]
MTSLVPSHPHFPSYINISLPTTIHSETLPSEQVQAQGHAQTQTQQRIDPCFAITKYPLTNIDAPCISATFASLYRAIRIFAVFYSTPATSACSGSAQTVSPTLAFFLFLSINCLLSSLSSPSPLFPSSKQSLLPSLALYHPLMLFQPCEAVSYNVNSNQRSDVPSDDLPPLIGPDFAYTQHTPLGNLEHAREYADGALMTQKLIAAPIVPIDRQMWVGVDTRTAYFGNNFGGEKISKVPELLQAGMRRLVIDLWWDGAGHGWQLCPRIKRDANQLSGLQLAMEQGQNNLEASLQLQRISNKQVAADEEDHPSTMPIGAHTMIPVISNQNEHIPGCKQYLKFKKKDHNINDKVNKLLEKRAAVNSSNNDNSNAEKRQKAKKTESGEHQSSQSAQRPVLPTLKDKTKTKIMVDDEKHSKTAASEREHALDYKARNQTALPGLLRKNLHQLASSKGIVSSYDKSLAIDQAIDGITCSTGEDLLMLLQGLQNWIEKTSENEYEDVVLIILNLNELASNTLGSQLPLRSPTPSSLLQPMPLPTSTDNSNTRKSTPVGNGTTVGLKNGTFFESVASLNTNRMIKALLPDRHSLHDLFTDAFPSLIYSPILLQKDREDLMSSWWKSGVVGLDYYNTTTDPLSGRIMTPTGWPTSAYLTEVIKRRIVVGIGSNNLSDNSTYNIMDDFTTLYAPGMLGPSMMNSSLLQVSTSLNLSTCDSPVPGVAMVPTGAETNSSVIKEPKEDGIKNGDNLKTMNVTWSFSSMSDSDLLPWSNTSIQLATTCGFSTLVKGRSPILTFSEQTAMTIWSWDINQPPPSQIRSRDRRCGAMQINGRWAAQDCNMKLPVACRRVNTSSVWIIYDQGAANYRDVTCPEGYAFDVPRTARENHQLYLTLLSYWNAAAPAFSINRSQRREHLKKAEGKYLTEKLLNNGNMPFNNKRHDQQYQDQDNYADDEEEGTDGSYPLPSTVSYARNGHGTSFLNREILNLTTSNALSRSGSTLPLSGGIPGAGMVWIDISSWQTAGCWVPGGIHGTCPYRPPDNTVALQEIIKVSTIGGVIVLVLMGMFLYLKCRRNVRLRKANKRRANVRNMIIRTEVETVPA